MTETVLIIAAIVAILIWHRRKSKKFWDKVDAPGDLKINVKEIER